MRFYIKRKGIAKRGKSELSKLKKKLWDIFSEFIRLRDSDGDTFTCISCGLTKIAYYIDEEGKRRSTGRLHAGHFHKSEMSGALRYDERNVNGQCDKCNRWDEGNRQGYEKGLIKKYGESIIQLLEIKQNNKVRWGKFEYEALIREYQEKLEKLKEQNYGI